MNNPNLDMGGLVAGNTGQVEAGEAGAVKSRRTILQGDGGLLNLPADFMLTGSQRFQMAAQQACGAGIAKDIRMGFHRREELPDLGDRDARPARQQNIAQARHIGGKLLTKC